MSGAIASWSEQVVSKREQVYFQNNPETPVFLGSWGLIWRQTCCLVEKTRSNVDCTITIGRGSRCRSNQQLSNSQRVLLGLVFVFWHSFLSHAYCIFLFIIHCSLYWSGEMRLTETWICGRDSPKGGGGGPLGADGDIGQRVRSVSR